MKTETVRNVHSYTRTRAYMLEGFLNTIILQNLGIRHLYIHSIMKKTQHRLPFLLMAGYHAVMVHQTCLQAVRLLVDLYRDTVKCQCPYRYQSLGNMIAKMSHHDADKNIGRYLSISSILLTPDNLQYLQIGQ